MTTRRNRGQRSGLTSIVVAFCTFLYEVPEGTTFTLWNLQGAVDAAAGDVHAKHILAESLRIAIEERWIRKTADESYLKIGHRRSSLAWAQLQELKDRIVCAAEGRAWLD